MPYSPREIVSRCLRFETPGRMPRDLWLLPWAANHYPQQITAIQERYPSDFISPPDVYQGSSIRKGDPYEDGTYTDEWGCQFTNIQRGVIGQVHHPILPDLRDWQGISPPYGILPADWHTARQLVNQFCASTPQFVMSGACPRPWERYQFIRGSENALIDMAHPDEYAMHLLNKIDEYYMRELEFWSATDVDALNFMDDWGAQKRLLISPNTWRSLFKPIYRRYCDLAHAHGKFIFMHSDGDILSIYPDLIEIGLDAINSQLFCMDLPKLVDCAKGKITFWGEIDRQQVLPNLNPEVGREAVRRIARHLYDSRGGMVAQLEFGAGANPETVLAVFDEWEKITS